MLVLGLGIPMVFGNVPAPIDNTADEIVLDPNFTDGAIDPLTGAPKGKGKGKGNGRGGASGGTSGLPGGAGSSSGVPGATTGSDPSGGGTAPGSPAAPGSSSGPLTATETGVTATTVKLGIVLLDIQSLEPVGFAQPHFRPEEQKQQYEVFINELNKNGGLSGRKVVGNYRIWNALDSNGDTSEGAVCRQMAEDDKVFAVVGVVSSVMTSCLTKDYGIPVIGNSQLLKSAYAGGMFVSPYANLERMGANWGELAVRSGVTKGRTIATVSARLPDERGPETEVSKQLLAGGADLVYRSDLGTDPASAQSQMPIEIAAMQREGVDTVFLVTNFISAIQFVQTADKQNFTPLYVVSDVGSISAEGLVQNMPASFNGAVVFTQGGDTEDPVTKQCRLTFNAATGNNYAAGNESGGTTLFCWMIQVFEAAADIAGTNLTRPGLANGYQRVTRPLGQVIGGSFGPNKTDYADFFRTARFASSCKCYQPLGKPVKGKF
jgi:ABC-type branched-subunit amino acid transport system substrate-binding protein